MEYTKLSDEHTPICYESGRWDGLKSDLLLVSYIEDYSVKYSVATAYSGFMDGSKFLNFYDDNDYEIINVTHFMKLPKIN